MQIGFWGLLTIVLIVLKLTKVILWSWWLVLLPLWVWVPFICLYLGFLAIVYLLAYSRRRK